MRAAVVTGAGSGIGAALCVELARRGYRIVAADRDEAGARATAETCCGLGPGLDSREARRSGQASNTTDTTHAAIPSKHTQAAIAMRGRCHRP